MTSTLRYLSSGTKVFAFRGKPHQDIKVLITQFAADNGIKAGAILTTVGSLEQINIRYANKSEGDARHGGYYEIVSLTGTFSESSAHLHLAVADGSGQLIGGHLLTGNLIYTTAEIVVVDLIDLEFHREVDSTYNYKELAIKAKS